MHLRGTRYTMVGEDLVLPLPQLNLKFGVHTLFYAHLSVPAIDYGSDHCSGHGVKKRMFQTVTLGRHETFHAKNWFYYQSSFDLRNRTTPFSVVVCVF